jgi:hypothetical protein
MLRLATLAFIFPTWIDLSHLCTLWYANVEAVQLIFPWFGDGAGH